MQQAPKSVKTLLIAGDAATIARERIADAATQAEAEGRPELAEALHSLHHTFSTAAMVIGDLASEELQALSS